MRKPLGSLTRHVRLVPRGIRLKLTFAYLLMSAVPLTMLVLVAGWFAFPHSRQLYHLDRWFPVIADSVASTWWLVGLILITVVIAVLGAAYLTVKIVEPVVRITHEATQLAQGDYTVRLPETGRDEFGVLGSSLNQLTSRIRTNMEELKQVGEQTTRLNREVQHRVMLLSTLTHIGELIGSGADVDAVLDLVVEQLAQFDDEGLTFLALHPLPGVTISPRHGRRLDLSLLADVPMSPETFVVDRTHAPVPPWRGLWERLGRPNLVLCPVVVRRQTIGTLGLGNRQREHVWTKEAIDLAAVFAKQAAMVLENELLVRKTKALTVHDELTGVYTEAYLRQRLTEELKRAVMYQRPCAVVRFSIAEFAAYHQRKGESQAAAVLKRAAHAIQESLGEVDRVGRFDDHDLLVVLPERNKRQALELAHDIGRQITSTFAAEADPEDHLTVVSGVAENPLDGATVEELLRKASEALGARGPASSAAPEGAGVDA